MVWQVSSRLVNLPHFRALTVFHPCPSLVLFLLMRAVLLRHVLRRFHSCSFASRFCSCSNSSLALCSRCAWSYMSSSSTSSFLLTSPRLELYLLLLFTVLRFFVLWVQSGLRCEPPASMLGATLTRSPFFSSFPHKSRHIMLVLFSSLERDPSNLLLVFFPAHLQHVLVFLKCTCTKGRFVLCSVHHINVVIIIRLLWLKLLHEGVQSLYENEI